MTMYYLKNRKVYPFKHSVTGDKLAFAKELKSHCRDSRRIRSSTVNGHWISTVFLPVNHGFDEPLFFETMVFVDGDFRDKYTVRCTTHRQALRQHRKVKQMVSDIAYGQL